MRPVTYLAVLQSASTKLVVVWLYVFYRRCCIYDALVCNIFKRYIALAGASLPLTVRSRAYTKRLPCGIMRCIKTCGFIPLGECRTSEISILFFFLLCKHTDLGISKGVYYKLCHSYRSSCCQLDYIATKIMLLSEQQSILILQVLIKSRM